MSGSPEISVVMANHNGERHLGAAITSLQNQSFQSWELIFVDDASLDGSVGLAKGMAASDARIRVLQQPERRGPGAARNRALAAARGRWLAIFDSDDLMQPARLNTLRERAERDRAVIVADNLTITNEEEKLRPFLPKSLTREPRWIGLAEFIDSNRLYSRSPDLGYLKPFVDAETLRNSGIVYDERLRIGEDYEFMKQLLARGHELRLEPSALYVYRRHSGSTSHRINGEEIAALIAADERFLHGASSLAPDVLKALARRRRSLESMLVYDRTVKLAKARQYGRAAAVALSEPRIWPLLTRPLRARLARRSGRQTRDVPKRAAARLS